MPAITSLGIGSGIDLNAMVTQLVAVERQPLKKMQQAASAMQTQLSALGRMQSLLSALQDAGDVLSKPTLWSGSTPSSSDAATVSASGTSAPVGSYAVAVQSLASGQTLASTSAFASAGDAVGSGRLTIELGSWDSGATAFTAKSGAAAVAIDVTAGDTLQTLRDKINASGAGVTASLITDAGGVRLALNSSSTGAVNGFRISARDDDGNNIDAAGLSRIAYDPLAGAVSMQRAQAASDAHATVNGIAVTSTTNQLSGVVDGLTFQLQKVSATPVSVSVASNTAAVQAAVKSFADAFNALAKNIADQTKYDPATKIAAPLQGDAPVLTLLNRLRGIVNIPSSASSLFPTLSSLGLEMQRDGTLSVNQGKLDAAVANLPELKKALANLDLAAPAANGFARRASQLASDVLGTSGSLALEQDGLRKQLQRNSDAQDALNRHADAYQQRLVQQFTAMDTQVAKMQALGSYVTQQLAAFSNSRSSGR
ncbi:MAG: flagellar filament capping protein FliD [Rubrivivax sp.]